MRKPHSNPVRKGLSSGWTTMRKPRIEPDYSIFRNQTERRRNDVGFAIEIVFVVVVVIAIVAAGNHRDPGLRSKHHQGQHYSLLRIVPGRNYLLRGLNYSILARNNMRGYGECHKFSVILDCCDYLSPLLISVWLSQCIWKPDQFKIYDSNLPSYLEGLVNGK